MNLPCFSDELVKKTSNNEYFSGSTVDPNTLRSELIVAIENNRLDKVRRILSQGVDPNSVCDEKGRWPVSLTLCVCVLCTN